MGGFFLGGGVWYDKLMHGANYVASHVNKGHHGRVSNNNKSEGVTASPPWIYPQPVDFTSSECTVQVDSGGCLFFLFAPMSETLAGERESERTQTSQAKLKLSYGVCLNSPPNPTLSLTWLLPFLVFLEQEGRECEKKTCSS